MTNDGSNTLTYDAENDLTSSYNLSSGTTTYSYDANHSRVKKSAGASSSTVYVFSGGQELAEYDNIAAPGTPSREYEYVERQLIATISGSATVYHHPDTLSTRLTTEYDRIPYQRTGTVAASLVKVTFRVISATGQKF